MVGGDGGGEGWWWGGEIYGDKTLLIKTIYKFLRFFFFFFLHLIFIYPPLQLKIKGLKQSLNSKHKDKCQLFKEKKQNNWDETFNTDR